MVKKVREKKMVASARRLYSAPAIEIHVSEPFELLAGTTKLTGTHEDGGDLGMFDEHGYYNDPGYMPEPEGPGPQGAKGNNMQTSQPWEGDLW